MIMQTAIYWLCHTILLVLSAKELELRRLELLAKKQLYLVEKGLAIAESINSFANRLEKEKDDKMDFSVLAPAFHEYALTLYQVFNALKELDNRAIVLANAAEDPDLKGKVFRLFTDMNTFLSVLPPFGWENPLSASLAVSKKCRTVNCATPAHWDLFPNNAWGCFNVYDKCWVEDEIERSGAGEHCTHIHPLQLAPKMDVPNYFYWACVYGVQSDENELGLFASELTHAMLASMSEEDKTGVEDNSTAPTMEQWALVQKALPEGVLLPVVPVRTHETVWDVMAGKEQVANIQMLLMQLVEE